MTQVIKHAKRIVVKLGTGILTGENGGVDYARIQCLSKQIATLKQNGIDVILVSSGAVGLGMERLGLSLRPQKLQELQKCAAVGQSILIETWQRCFHEHAINVAQVLLTGSDILQPSHNRIFGDFLEEVLRSGLIPVVNENDSVSTDGFKLGDNDSLAALLALRVQADHLVILSTIPGLLKLPENELIEHVEHISADIEALAQGTQSPTATGGMTTKIRAARLAVSSGCAVFIGSGADDQILVDLFNKGTTGTYFKAKSVSRKSRKRLNRMRWKVHFGKPKGRVIVDTGASEALLEDGRSLLPRGIVGVSGSFKRGDIVDIAKPDDKVFARGIIEFDHNELEMVLGKTSDAVFEQDPKRKRSEAIHRDSLVLLG